MKTFTIELIHKFFDTTVRVENSPFSSPGSCRCLAPAMFAVPENWLVVRITDDATNEIVYDGN